MHGLQDGEAEERCKEDGDHLARIRCKQELYRLSDIIVNAPAFLNCGNDGGKVIIGKHHIGNILCNVCTGYAHADAYIG